MRVYFLFAILLGALLLASCGGAGNVGSRGPGGSDSESTATSSSTASLDDAGKRVSVAGGTFVRLSPDELRAMLERKDFVFVNTHVPFAGDISRTDLSIPYNQIGQSLNKLPEDKNAKIVLYCRSGRMSAEAARTLVGLGYKNVWDLEGGMEAWKEAGLPLEGA